MAQQPQALLICIISIFTLRIISSKVNLGINDETNNPPMISWKLPAFTDSEIQNGVTEVNVTFLNNQRKRGCFILSCQAAYPIYWIYDTKETPVVEIRYSRKNGHGPEKYVYNSEFQVCSVSAVFTGWYNCTAVNQDKKDVNGRTLKASLYIFFRDGGEYRLLWGNKINVIPVSPTSKRVLLPCVIDTSLWDTEVFLFHQGQLYKNATYDPKYGFTVLLDKPLGPRGISFECRIFHHGSHSNENPDFQVIRVHLAVDVEADPKAVSLPIGDTDRIILRCSSKSGIAMSRNGQVLLRSSTFINGSYILEVESAKHGGLYSCIRIGKNTSLHVLYNQRLAIWNVVYFEPDRQVEVTLSMESNRIKCDAGKGFSDIEFRQSKCQTLEECQQLESSWKNRTDRCSTYPTNVWEPMMQPFQGCGRSSRSCKIYAVESTGFVQCYAKELDCGGVGDSNINCGGVIQPVLATIETFNKRFTPTEILQCDVANQTYFSDSGLFVVKGMCALISKKNSIWSLQCFANRRYFIGGMRWEYSFGSNLKETYTLHDNSTWIIVPEIQSTIHEEFDGDNIKSTLSIYMEEKPSKDFTGYIHCIAPRYGEISEERIYTEFNIKREMAPVFPNGRKQETVELGVGQPGNLSCAVNAYPLPEVLWYKQIKNPNASGYIDVPINNDEMAMSPLFKDILISDYNQTLTFQSFRDSQEGRYKCVAKMSYLYRVREGSKEITQGLNVTIEKIIVVSPTGDKRSSLIIIICIVSVFCVLALVAAVFYNRRFIMEKKNANVLTDMEIYEFIHGNQSAYNEELDIAEQSYVLPYNMDYEFSKDKLTFGKQLGSGAYGTVLKAEALGIMEPEVVTTVAVKTIAPSADILYLKALLAELKVMIHIGKHTNVVSLLGACTINLKKREVFVIVEYCQFGNLQQYLLKGRYFFRNQIVDNKICPNAEPRLSESGYATFIPEEFRPRTDSYLEASTSSGSVEHHNTGGSDQPLWRNNMQGDYKESDCSSLNTTDLINWAYQIANGMAYLASKKVFHGDLATRNILLARNNVVKVADFGLARHVYKDTNYIKSQNCPLPVKWMAIESLLRLEFSTQSDIWSFGVVLWEMFSLGYVPYPGVEVDGDFVHKLIGGYRMSAPRYCTDTIYRIMLNCWREEPLDRPAFPFLCQVFGQMLKSIDSNQYHQVVIEPLYQTTPKASLGIDNPVYVNDIQRETHSGPETKSSTSQYLPRMEQTKL